MRLTHGMDGGYEKWVAYGTLGSPGVAVAGLPAGSPATAVCFALLSWSCCLLSQMGRVSARGERCCGLPRLGLRWPQPGAPWLRRG
jgi:hypothetical protein